MKAVLFCLLFVIACTFALDVTIGEGTNQFVLIVDTDSGVPRYEFYLTESQDVKYYLTLDNVYEATVDANGIVSEIPSTNVAIDGLNFDITDPVSDIDDTLTFDISNTKGSRRWSILQFVNHLDQSTEVNAAGNVSYAFKFDVIIGNYSWVSTDPNAYLVLELGFTFAAPQDDSSSSFSSISSLTYSSGSEGDSFSSGSSFSSFSTVSGGSEFSTEVSGGSEFSTGISAGSEFSTGFSTVSTGFSTVSTGFSTVSGSNGLDKRDVSGSEFSTGFSTVSGGSDFSTGVSGGSEFSTGFSTVSGGSEFSTGFSSASSEGSFGSFSTGFSSVSENSNDDGGDDNDPNDGLVEVIGEDDLALVQAIFTVAPTANNGDVSVSIVYTSKIKIIYSHFDGTLVHDPTVGIDSNRDIQPAYTRTNNNNGGSSSSNNSSGNNSSSASHLAFSFVVLLVCFFLF